MYDPALIREAFQRELARGGQVYFLHNEVDTIENTARELGELVPDARIRIAHGQMPERELEQVMLDFYRQRFNVLVCTTIIESGIDVPSANTIVVNRADRFGLAQLHQLRGRVGRSHHRAYAYLVIPDRRAITADAEKRLEALASLEELGAGFTLATHDLEIRGAGELLGEEQSGQIEEIGFSLYTEMLDRAVRALKSGKVPDFDLRSEHEAEIELHVPALIPDDYLPDVNARLTLYKRISSARDEDELRELQVEMIDRFGLLPDPVKNLFAVTQLKLAATPLGIRKLELGANGGRVISAQPNVEPLTIIKMIQASRGVCAGWAGQAEGEPGTARRHGTLRAAQDVLCRWEHAGQVDRLVYTQTVPKVFKPYPRSFPAKAWNPVSSTSAQTLGSQFAGMMEEHSASSAAQQTLAPYSSPQELVPGSHVVRGRAALLEAIRGATASPALRFAARPLPPCHTGRAATRGTLRRPAVRSPPLSTASPRRPASYWRWKPPALCWMFRGSPVA